MGWDVWTLASVVVVVHQLRSHLTHPGRAWLAPLGRVRQRRGGDGGFPSAYRPCLGTTVMVDLVLLLITPSSPCQTSIPSPLTLCL